MAKKIIWLFLLFTCGGVLFSQAHPRADENKLSAEMAERVVLANSVKDYPVTPGDVYTLTYLTSGGSRAIDVTVQSDFSLNLGVFGELSAKDITYQELRQKIENLVRRSYPGSRPRLVIFSTGVFRVYLKGEVTKAQYVNCWGLSHLSEVITDKTTRFSSLRDLEMRSDDGKTGTGFFFF